VTEQILACLGSDDRIDLVELNDRFVERLRQRFQTDPAFQPAASRAQIHHCPVEALAGHATYDVIVSGLPLNNFDPDEVERILATLRSLLRPNGTLSFFEYIGIRYARAVVSGRRQRERLRTISRVLNALLREHEIRREWIWPNVPPAWVHHVRFAPEVGEARGCAGPAVLPEKT
jgi:phospholipid N-methyltransferase